MPMAKRGHFTGLMKERAMGPDGEGPEEKRLEEGSGREQAKGGTGRTAWEEETAWMD